MRIVADMKNGDSYQDCEYDTHDSCDCWHFRNLFDICKRKTVTVTRIVTRTPAILVTVGTVEIFDIKKRRQLREWHLRGLKNEDSYEDLDLDTHRPCDCSHI